MATIPSIASKLAASQAALETAHQLNTVAKSISELAFSLKFEATGTVNITADARLFGTSTPTSTPADWVQTETSNLLALVSALNTAIQSALSSYADGYKEQAATIITATIAGLQA